jgi:exonuclease III
VTPKLEACVKKAHIYTDERFSDHAPLIMDYEKEL